MTTFDEGFAAHQDKQLTDSPYPAGSGEEFEWKLGWQSAAEEKLGLVHDEGVDAYVDSKGTATNPYALGTVQHEAWQKGWDAVASNHQWATLHRL